MPPAFLGFVGQVGAFIIQGTLALTGGNIAAAVFILDTAAKLAGLQLLGYLSGKLTNTPDLGQERAGQQVLVRGTIEHQRIVYGENLVGGVLQYQNTAGEYNQSLFHSIIVAGHECEDITEFYLDNSRIESGWIDWGTDGGVNSGDFRGDTALQTPVFFEKNLGSSDQAASNQMSFFFADITTSHNGKSLCYFTSRFDYSDGQTDVWSAGLPNEIKALVKGKLVYDPRSDDTQSFGTGPHRVDSSPTWEYSNNPALCWADYLIDNYLGVGIATSKVDYSYVASAAEYCDAQVDIPNSSHTRFTCNGVLSTGDTHRRNLEKILSSFNGTMTRANGKWKIRAPYYNTPSLSLNEDNLRKDIELALDADENDRFNHVRGFFIDRTRLYQASQFPTVTSTEYFNRDDDQIKYEDLNLAMTDDPYMAQRLAFGILEQGNLQARVVFPSNFKILPAEVGGTVSLSLDKLGWVDKDFRVLGYTFQDMQGIDLILREDDSAAYAEVGTPEYNILSPEGIYTAGNPGVPYPTNLYATSNDENVFLSWTNPPARLFEYAIVWRNSVNSFDNAEQISRVRVDRYVDIGPQYFENFYWVQAENFAGAVSTYAKDTGGTHQAVSAVLHRDFGGVFSDPTFDLTTFQNCDTAHCYVTFPQGGAEHPSGPYLGNINTGTFTSSVTHGFADVFSEGAGVGGSQHFSIGWFTPSEWAVNANDTVIVKGSRLYPLKRIGGAHVNVRWRCSTFTAVNSAYFNVRVQGVRGLRDPNAVDLGATKTNLTNSTDWAVMSDFYSMTSYVDTYTHLYVDWLLKINAMTPTTSQQIRLDFENFRCEWKDS